MLIKPLRITPPVQIVNSVSNSVFPPRLVLVNKQAPGDILMLTAAVRDLKRMIGDKIEVGVDTTAYALWQNNPHINPSLKSYDKSLITLELGYASRMRMSNSVPGHFIEGFHHSIGKHFGVRIPVTEYKGDVHLTQDEIAQEWPATNYWVLVCGGKHDVTCKWWNPDHARKVVEHFKGRVTFIQVGAVKPDHVHWPIEGAINMIGKTSEREFLQLIYHAAGVLCPVTFAMHAAAAVPTKDGKLRPCVVVAGGREPPHWEAYPGHQFLHTVGALPCCATGGCWRQRCQTLGDGKKRDMENLCDTPVQITENLRIPKCMQMITPERVIQAIESYYAGGACSYAS